MKSQKELLIVVTHKGVFRYCHQPFGITSVPVLFQREMDQILSGLPGVQYYLDDILDTGKDEEDYLRTWMWPCRDWRTTGCEFVRSNVHSSNHQLNTLDRSSTPEAFTRIHPRSRLFWTPQFLRMWANYVFFLGLPNFYGCFIPSLATKLKLLHQLFCQDKTWKWREQCEEAFMKTLEIWSIGTLRAVNAHPTSLWC